MEIPLIEPKKSTKKSKESNLSFSEIMQLYQDSLSANRKLFNEQRANIQLFAGDHYASLRKFGVNDRNGNVVDREQRVRLTENHIQKINKRYINMMVNSIPGIGIFPYSENEPSDVKVAELHQKVWDDIKEKHDLDNKFIFQAAYNFVVPGELFVKVIWDNKANFRSYETFYDEEGNEIDGDYIYDGDFDIEILPSYDVLTDPSPLSWEKCPALIVRKLVHKDELIGLFPNKRELIHEGVEEEFKIWNTVTHNFEFSRKNLVRVLEAFYRSSSRFPSGRYAVTTMGGILDQGDIPLGLFPILKVGWDDIEQSPRSRSINKQLRPLQGEINRMGSKITEHQITLGDDKIVTYDGSKVTPGASLPGVRQYKVSGQVLQVIPGKAGDQYLPHMQRIISTMYNIAMLEELDKKTAEANQDPWAKLYQSMKEKQEFNIYQSKLMGFFKQLAWNLLFMAKYYYRADRLILTASRSEQPNLVEFKKIDPLSYQIKVKNVSSDLDSMFAKQMSFQHLLQYIGNTLGHDNPQVLGSILKAMPFLNEHDIVTDLTIDEDNIRNDILALDRGEMRAIKPYDNHSFIIKRLTKRMKSPDFPYLPPEIQKNYSDKRTAHEQMKAQQAQAIEKAKAGFIPMGGGMVSINLSAPDPITGKQKRIYLPSSSVEWLVNKLRDQGLADQELGSLPPDSQANILSGKEPSGSKKGDLRRNAGVGAGLQLGAEQYKEPLTKQDVQVLPGQ